MTLRDLLSECAVTRFEGALDGEILGVAYDSRAVRPGFVFVAIRGTRSDGNRFVDAAVDLGAAAIVSVAPPPSSLHGVWVQVENDRKALASLAGRFYEHPTRKLHVVGVTGTNGKTTITYLVESILKAAGHPSAVFGTIEYRGPGFEVAAERTTPEAPDLEALFKKVVDAGWKHAVMEVSSHAVALERVAGLRFEIAVFTNLTRDHLDFHGDMQTYFLEKKKLFTGLDGVVPRVLVLNRDDPRFESLRQVDPARVISYGLDSESDVRIMDHRIDLSGMSAAFQTPSGELHVRSRLVGRPNLSNLGASIATGLGLGISLEAIRSGIEGLSGVPGRFELIDEGQDFRVVVDFAHTDDALEKVLASARGMTAGKLIVVFGCGGERDRTKRPKMGAAAARGGDFAVATSDNPRGEDPMAILGEVEAGFREAGAEPGVRYEIVEDRRDAIRFALQRAVSGDTVVLAGKGHESVQVIGNEKIPFDDRIVARELLNELAAGRNR